MHQQRKEGLYREHKIAYSSIYIYVRKYYNKPCNNNSESLEFSTRADVKLTLHETDVEFWSSRTLEKIRVPNPPANDEFTLLRLRSSRNTPFISHWILAIPPSFWPMGDRQVKEVGLGPLSLTAATNIGGVIITVSNNIIHMS